MSRDPTGGDPRPGEPPLFAGSILGLRAWVVQAHLPSSATRLGSTFAEATWAPGGEWTKAGCRPGGLWGGRHPAPHRDCGCGLYGLHPWTGVVEELFEEHVELRGRWELRDPCLIELVGPLGLIEASGRIEVHESGFRAERARPLALIAGAHWPAAPREAIEELAALYDAEVLEVRGARELLAFASERGGALSEGRVRELIEPVRPPDAPAPPAAPAAPPGSPPPAPPPPSPPASGLRRAWGGFLEVLGKGVLVLLGVLWYGFWTVLVVSIAGGFLFGWFEEEPTPPPAKIRALEVDRERCAVAATVVARRPLRKLTVRITGRDEKGLGLGHLERAIGPIPKGRSSQRVATMKPKLCDAPYSFSVRVRTVWGGSLGAPVSVGAVAAGEVGRATSRPRGGDVRNRDADATKQGQ